MTNTAIAVDGRQALQVRLQLAAKIPFDHDSATRDRVGNARQLLFTELTRTDIGINPCFLKDLGRGFPANTKNIGKRGLDALLVRDFDSE